MFLAEVKLIVPILHVVNLKHDKICISIPHSKLWEDYLSPGDLRRW